MNINHISSAASPQMDQMIVRHEEVFKDGLGTYRGHSVAIQLKTGATPKFLKARPVLFATRERVEKEIDRLESKAVLCPTSFSEWATPVVPIIKKETLDYVATTAVLLMKRLNQIAILCRRQMKFSLPLLVEDFSQL